jgi:hypothetical protein
MPSKHVTHIKVPIALYHRLKQRRDEMQRAYGEGRLPVPGKYAERIPLHYIISNLLDETDARRARSARPRRPPNLQETPNGQAH